MKGMRPATQFLVCWLIAAATASAQTIDLASSRGRRTMDGHVAGAHAGAWLHVGDLTGDFFTKELIIGLPDDNSSRGAVRVMLRRLEAASAMTTIADAVFIGAAAGDLFGAAADAGYVTNVEVRTERGAPVGATPPRDLIVGAPGAFGGRGAVYVFAGSATSGSSTSAGDAVFRVVGATAGDRLGSALESADLNGDGYRELILPVPSRGLVYVIDVQNTPTSSVDLASPFQGMLISGLGNEVSVATGDVDGDRQFDLAIGDPGAQSQRGAVYVVLGAQSTLPTSLVLPSQADAQALGSDPGDRFGTSLWIADIDDDGDARADVIIGAPGGDGTGLRTDAGEVLVIWGRSPFVGTVAPGLTLYGAGPGHRLGTRVTAGDITRDSPDDLALLAPGANGGAGEVYAYFGRHSFDFPTAADLLDRADRRIVSDETVGAVSAIRIWEATGEGAEEVIVGVSGASTSAGPSAGRIYVPLSPRIDLNPATLNLIAIQGGSQAAVVDIANPSATGVTFNTNPGASWLALSPASGVTVEGAPSALAITASAANLSVGDHSSTVSIVSTTRQLAMTIQVRVNLKVLAAPTLTASFTGSLPLGQSATWTATADSSAGPVEYLFRRFTPATGWTMVQDYSSSNTYTWTPGDGDSGQYVMEIWVRAVGSTDAFDAQVATGYFPVGNATPLIILSQKADFDGDGRTDLAVYRPSNGTWYALLSGAQYGLAMSRSWGVATDVPVPGDYDGDGRTDFAVYRPSNGGWYVLLSGNGFSTTLVRSYGLSTDIPVPGDYDGDGRNDLALFRPSTGTWYVMRSDSGFTTTIVRSWGTGTDIPVPGDYDGDRRSDFAVYRPSNGTWYVLESITGFGSVLKRSYGTATDRPVPADYDGDGLFDLAVFRPATGMWYVLQSSTGFGSALTRSWGVSTDVPVPGDFNGDLRADFAVFRPEASARWFVWSQFTRSWGTAGDIPLMMR